MKKEINPAIAIVVVVILVGIVGFFLMQRTGGGEAVTPEQNKMPAEAGNAMRQMMENANKNTPKRN